MKGTTATMWNKKNAPSWRCPRAVILLASAGQHLSSTTTTATATRTAGASSTALPAARPRQSPPDRSSESMPTHTSAAAPTARAKVEGTIPPPAVL